VTGPLSIVHVLEKTSPTTGSVVQMLEAVREQVKRGHRVGAVTRQGSELPATIRKLNAECFELPLRNPFDLISAVTLRRILVSRATDVVHVHKGTAHALALWAATGLGNRPSVIVNRGVSFPLDRFNRWKYRHPRVAAVVCVSENVRRTVIDSTGIRGDKAVTVHAGVDVDRFDSTVADGLEIRQELGLTPDHPLVAQVSVRDWKGWRELVQAFAPITQEFPEARLLLVGCEGDDILERVRAEARRRFIDGQLLLLPFRHDMPDVLSAADVVIDASWSGTGITGTIREAMALERAVVATDCGGNTELVVDEECGLVVPPRDVHALTSAITRLLRDPGLRRRFGAAARIRVVESFSTEVRADRLDRIYARAAGLSV